MKADVKGSQNLLLCGKEKQVTDQCDYDSVCVYMFLMKVAQIHVNICTELIRQAAY